MFRDPNFQHQDGVNWDLHSHVTAAGLFQCLNMSVMNDGTWFRLEFIVCNGIHKLTFESWVCRKMVLRSQLSTPRWCVLGSSQPCHISWTVSMSQYECNE
eukprot:scaffold20647_cov91-Cyclotella_meneghiniana.AAC.1